MVPNSASRFYTEYISREARVEEDRLWKVLASLPEGPARLLDIGCGSGRNLMFIARHRPQYELVGTDIAETTASVLAELGLHGVCADAAQGLPFPDASFDTVLCGEVIEHVIDTDGMLREIHRILKPSGKLILTTPNLAYVPNRVLLLLGIQPLFTETSIATNLGRKFSFLGQGGQTQGHLKIFTLAAAEELLKLTSFEVVNARGYRFFQSGVLGLVDRLLAGKASFAAGFVIDAQKR
jgi:SAM-dependent methyltransferase